MLKLGGVALAGYVLGRLKKGRAAVGLAMWAAGVKADPKALLRQGLLNLANSDEGRELLSQLRGPMLEAGRKAAGATIEGQVSALTAALQKRTQTLTQGPEETEDGNDTDESDTDQSDTAQSDADEADTDEYDDYDDAAEDESGTEEDAGEDEEEDEEEDEDEDADEAEADVGE